MRGGLAQGLEGKDLVLTNGRLRSPVLAGASADWFVSLPKTKPREAGFWGLPAEREAGFP